MEPHRLPDLMKKRGQLETHPAEQVFHAQAFPETLFMLKKGYVKRYQINKTEERVIELIYGPGHIFPLSQLYKQLFGVEQNQDDLVYVYQAMTDIEIWSIGCNEIVSELEKDPRLYMDLFYEAGLRLRSNIYRLASNALKDDYKKVAHQFVCLAEEFGKTKEQSGKQTIEIMVPLLPQDMAEQLNISVEAAEAVIDSLTRNNLITVEGHTVQISDLDLLKDVYL